MESRPKNPEFRNNPENFHPCTIPNATYQGPLNLTEEVFKFFFVLYMGVAVMGSYLNKLLSSKESLYKSSIGAVFFRDVEEFDRRWSHWNMFMISSPISI